MTTNNDKTSDEAQIVEGSARLRVPKTVFYNPVQEFNRDLSVFVTRTYLKHDLWNHRNQRKHVEARGGLKILDALSASGLRSIRYAKELKEQSDIVKEIVANDLSEAAVELIKQNIAHKVRASHSDAINVMHQSGIGYDDRFHVIDLDPFGIGAQFFDTAVRTIGEAGLLMVTCTDTAVLCGNASESCHARYGSMSLKADFCHEFALRIILRSIESHANVYGRYIKPLLCISVDFYVRLFIQIYTQQSETKMSASKLAQVYVCKECKSHELQPLGECRLKDDPKQAQSVNATVAYKFKPPDVRVSDQCRICGGRYVMGGPIWTKPIHDKSFLELLRQEMQQDENIANEFATFKRIEGIVQMCYEELDTPALFYSIDGMSSVLKMTMPRMNSLMSALFNANYKASLTHSNKTGLKTDAPSDVVWDMFCQYASEFSHEQRSQKSANDALMIRITQRSNERRRQPDSAELRRYDFAHNPNILADSKRLSMLRYQVNPTRDWGPKPRPVTAAAAATIRDDDNGDVCKRRKIDSGDAAAGNRDISRDATTTTTTTPHNKV